MTAPLRYDTMIQQFVTEVPELTGLYRHEADLWETDKDPLSPHLFFGTAITKVIELLYVMHRDEGSQQAKDIVDRILAFIERAVQSDDDSVVDAVYTGFLEGAYVAGHHYDEVTGLFLPETRKALLIVEKDFPKPNFPPGERLPFEDGTLNFLYDCVDILKKPPKLKHLKKMRKQARRDAGRTQRRTKNQSAE